MKIRNGFVSNSSSSSFCIVGVRKNFEDLKELFKQNENKLTKKFGEFDDSGDNDYEYLNFLTEKSKIEHLVSWECECYYAGISIDKMKNDQTLKEFKQEVCDKMNKEFISNYDWKDMEIINDEISN